MGFYYGVIFNLGSSFRNFQTFPKFKVYLAKHDKKLTSKQFNLNVITYEVPPAVYKPGDILKYFD